MIQQENPTLACAGIGPVNAAISRNLILHKVYDRVKKCQSVRSSQKIDILTLAIVIQSHALPVDHCSRNAKSP